MAAVGPLVSKKVVPFVKFLPLAMPRSNVGAPCQILAARVKLSNFGRPGGPYTPAPVRRVAALGEALSHAFRLTLVQTVPRRFLTLSYALSRPSERQRRSTRSPRRPDRFSCRHSGDPGVGKGAQDGQEKRPELRGELHLAAFPRLQRPAQAAVSCTAIKTR